MNSRIASLVLVASLVMSAHTASAQELSLEEIVAAAVESPGFLTAVGGCFTPADAPETLTVTVLVDADGKSNLINVVPLLQMQTTSCVGQAVKGLAMPATGGDMEITFDVAVTPTAYTPAPTNPTPPPTTLVVAPPPTMMPVPESAWRPLYSSGKRRVVGGAIMLGLGGAFLLGSIGLLATDDNIISSSMGAVLLVMGLGLTIPGAILVGVGKRRKRQALKIRDGLALAPIPAVVPIHKGGAIVLSWIF